MGDDRTHHRIDQRYPKEEARHGEVGARNGEIRRQGPQDHREGDQRGEGRDQQDRIGVDAIAHLPAIDEAVHVFGDALVGVVGVEALEAHAIMGGAIEPAAHIMLGQPPPPADHEDRLRDEFDDGADDVDRHPEQEDCVEQGPESRLILVLDRVEPVAVEEGQAHIDADLRLVHHHQKDHSRNGEAIFAHLEGAEGPDARLRHALAFEIAIRDGADAAHDLQVGHGPDEDAEHGHRQRHAIGQLVGLERLRPQPHHGQQEEPAEDHHFRGEDHDEDFQEGGDARRLECGARAEQPAHAQQERGNIRRGPPDPEGDHREGRDGQTEERHVES